MNKLKKSGLFFLFFIFSNINAMEKNNDDTNNDTIEQFKDDEESKYHEWCILGAKTIGVGVAAYICKLSPFGKLAAIFFPTKFTIIDGRRLTSNKSTKTDFSHIAQWHKEIAVKYPDANFDTIDFKESLTPGKYSWSAMQHGISHPKNTIYCPTSTLQQIDDAYQKRINEQSLTDDEQQTLKGSETIALHEAGHLKNNDVINSLFVNLGIATGIESSYQIYKRKIANSIPKRSLPKRFGIGCAIFASMSTAGALATSCYSRNIMEIRADRFAFQHADNEALLAGKTSFKEAQKQQEILEIRINNHMKNSDSLTIQTIEKLSKNSVNLFASHPPVHSRIQAIDNEIARRNKKQI